MRDIYFLNKGDTIDKIKYEYNLENASISNEKKFGHSFVNLSSGTDEILVVKNYLPYFLLKASEDDTIMDIMARGFQINGDQDISVNDLIVLNKPKSIRYIVSPLQKIEDIAKEIGVNTKYIIESNNLKSEKLFIGQILWL